MKNKNTQPDLGKWKEIRYNLLEDNNVEPEKEIISGKDSTDTFNDIKKSKLFNIAKWREKRENGTQVK